MTEDTKIDREHRQLALMLERLGSFQTGRLALRILVDDLEVLVNSLELASDDWCDEFRTNWLDLEVAYAVASDKLAPNPDMTDAGVADAVRSLEAMVRRQLGDGER